MSVTIGMINYNEKNPIMFMIGLNRKKVKQNKNEYKENEKISF